MLCERKSQINTSFSLPAEKNLYKKIIEKNVNRVQSRLGHLYSKENEWRGEEVIKHLWRE